jgi:hypothetical protein
MRRAVRENAPIALLGVLASLTMAWLGLYGFTWNDYEFEVLPAYNALVHGHVELFLRLAPVYGGSMLERAPFALLPGIWGGGELAVYRAVALPCLLAGAAFTVWLVARMRAQGRTLLARSIAAGVCLANPLTLRALELGHPEELLGAVLCVTAVLLAARGRGLWAGVLLGVAIANKQWALLAVGPVLLALPARRALCAAVIAAVAGAILAPLLLVGSGGFAAATRAAASTSSTIFQPWQAWWFLGHHGPIVRGLLGSVKVGYRTAPHWVGAVSHPLIVALALPISGLYWWQRREGSVTSTGQNDALGLLALLLLVRCYLDTWDVAYYPLPFMFALLTWEVSWSRLPLLAFSASTLAWLDFLWLPGRVSADAQAGFFLLWATAFLIWIALRIYAPASVARASAQNRQLLSQPEPSAPWAAH